MEWELETDHDDLHLKDGEERCYVIGQLLFCF